MHIAKTILAIFDIKMTTPTPYGWFHLLTLALTIAATVYLCRRARTDSPRQISRIVLWTAVTVIALEIYKQINFSFPFDENGIRFEYQWHAFPWQFCSTPMYVGLLAGLTKRGRLHDSLCAYLATYGIFAGVCVMLYPVTIFVDTVGINIQTTICHGSMIAIGVYLLASNHVKAEYKTVLKALPVFIAGVAIACLLNEMAYRLGITESHAFNMFFISPYTAPELPVYSLVQQVVPFPWSLIIYVAAFTLAACIIILFATLPEKLVKRSPVPVA